MTSLINGLLRFAFDHDVGYVLTRDLQPTTPSMADCESRIIVINLDWHNPKELPLMIAHEIGHVLNDDSGVLYYATPASHSNIEDNADNAGLRILLPIYFKNFYSCENLEDIN